MSGSNIGNLKTLQGWRNTRDAAILELKKNMEVITENAPTSQAYKDARANSEAINEEISSIAVLGLKRDQLRSGHFRTSCQTRSSVEKSAR